MFPLSQALLSGHVQELPAQTQFLLTCSGLLPLFLSSGYHLFLAVWFSQILAQLFCRPLPLPAHRYVQLGLSLSLTVLLGMQSGWTGGMVRAFVYSTMLSLGSFWHIRPHRLWVFLWSTLATACLGTGTAIGFLLSTACMLAFSLAGDSKTRAFFYTSFAPLPILAWHNGILALSAPIANTLFAPLLGFICLPLSFCLQLLPTSNTKLKIAELLENGISQILVGVAFFQEHFGFTFSIERSHWFCLFFALGIATAARQKKVRIAAFILLGCTVAARLTLKTELSILDVGQGDASFLQQDKLRTLIDFGPEKGLTLVDQVLRRKGISRLDALLLTHPDLDHRGGLPLLLQRMKIQKGIWFRGDMLQETGMLPVLLAVEQASVPIHLLSERNQPPSLQCWLAPPVTRNDFSPLCQARWRSGLTTLFTGDMDFSAERYFLAHLAPFPKVQVLKIAHHGSATSTLPDFLLASDAREAVISVGKNNYGHPSVGALNRIRGNGRIVRRTDLEGNINYLALPAIFPKKWLFQDD